MKADKTNHVTTGACHWNNFDCDFFQLTWERIDVDDSILLGLAVDDDVDADQTHIHGLTDGGPQLLQ